MADDITQTRAPHLTSHRAERAGRRYLLWCLLSPLALYLFPIFAERLPALQPWSVSQYGTSLDHSFGLDGDNADIVIFGDSSAMTGADTYRLSQQLGLKVTTLPASAGSLSVTGNLTLRRYLAGNRPPRLIVAYLAPWDLDFENQPYALTYEGVELILRHESFRQVLERTWHRPKIFLTFPIRFYAVPSRLNSFSDHSKLTPTPIFRGYSPHGGDDHLAANCSLAGYMTHRSATRSVQRLVHDFSSAQTTVLVYLSPVPNCLHSTEVAAFRYPEINAQPPIVMPAADFARDDSLVHVLASHSAESTGLLAQAIRKAVLR